MRQYVLTDQDFEVLLRTLELHKHKSTGMTNTNLAIEIKRAIEETKASGLASGVTERSLEFLLNDVHRSFHYHVYQWIQEAKK